MDSMTYISGASGYAGSRISAHLAGQGRNLILASRDPIRVEELADQLRRKYSNIKIQTLLCDLSSVDSWHASTEKLLNFEVDCYINCSGIQGKLGPSHEIDYEEMNLVFKVNLFSSMYFSNFFANRINTGNQLKIIHFSGGGSTGPRPLFMPYSLSKTSLLRFVENFAAENVGKNIQINAIAPGVMPSQMQEEIIQSLEVVGSKDFAVAEKSLSERKSDLPKLTELCDFLISERSMGISGKLISAEWDNWAEWPNHLEDLKSSDLYTLRRITGRDRGQNGGDL